MSVHVEESEREDGSDGTRPRDEEAVGRLELLGQVRLHEHAQNEQDDALHQVGHKSLRNEMNESIVRQNEINASIGERLRTRLRKRVGTNFLRPMTVR